MGAAYPVILNLLVITQSESRTIQIYNQYDILPITDLDNSLYSHPLPIPVTLIIIFSISSFPHSNKNTKAAFYY